MSTYKIIVFFTFLLFIISCKNVNNRQASNNDNESKIASDTITSENPLNKLTNYEILDGWLTLEVSQSIIIDKLGSTEKKDKETYLGATGTYAQTWEYPEKGISLVMESDSEGGRKKVRSISAFYPCKLTTSRGIIIGSSEDFVKEKYLNLINLTESEPDAIVIGSIYGGTIFTLESGIVSRIFIGALFE